MKIFILAAAALVTVLYFILLYIYRRRPPEEDADGVKERRLRKIGKGVASGKYALEGDIVELSLPEHAPECLRILAEIVRLRDGDEGLAGRIDNFAGAIDMATGEQTSFDAFCRGMSAFEDGMRFLMRERSLVEDSFMRVTRGRSLPYEVWESTMTELKNSYSV